MYQLTLIDYPSGRFGWVGSVPIELCKKKDTLYGKQYDSKVYNTPLEAIQDAKNNNITNYEILKSIKEKYLL